MSRDGVLHVESSGELEGRSDKDLLKIYNEVTRTKHPRLPAPRAQIIERILLVLARRGERPEKPVPKKKKAPKKNYHKPFDFDPTPTPKIPRRGTNRATVLALCRKGTTIENVMKVTGQSLKMAYQDVRRVHVDLGYGLREDEKGFIRATTIDEEVMG